MADSDSSSLRRPFNPNFAPILPHFIFHLWHFYVCPKHSILPVDDVFFAALKLMFCFLINLIYVRKKFLAHVKCIKLYKKNTCGTHSSSLGRKTKCTCVHPKRLLWGFLTPLSSSNTGVIFFWPHISESTQINVSVIFCTILVNSALSSSEPATTSTVGSSFSTVTSQLFAFRLPAPRPHYL